MWRLFKNNESHKQEETETDKASKLQTKTIVTKTGTKKVPVTDEQEVKESYDDSVLFDYDASAEITDEVTEEAKVGETEIANTDLEERMRVIDAIMKKSPQISSPNNDDSLLKEDLAKFDVIKEGAKILDSEVEVEEEIVSDSEESILGSSTLNQAKNDTVEMFSETNPAVLDVDEDDQLVSGTIEDIQEEELGDDNDDTVATNIKVIDDLFYSLKNDFNSAYLAGVMFEKEDLNVMYNLNFQDHQIELEANFYKHLVDALAQSNFSKLSDYYVLDLKENQIVLVLTLELHHIVLVFDKREIKMGYMLSIIKPQVVEAYNKYISK